ncbi:MAG: heavy metal transporter [Flavobacteriaceae bacterium]|nr:MAG: heavy metal transporter [Flavobacteriaceae bacterium]
MKTKSNKLIGAGLFTAVAASLCCITPVLALISGASGATSSFSWVEPFRPYLLGITILVLAFAWYQILKQRTAEEIQCDCEENIKKPFMQTKMFLGIVTVFAFIMMAFPYYGQIFYPDNKKEVVIVHQSNIQTINFDIKGMTCASCEEHVKHAVNELEGIVNVKASFEKANAEVEFDNTKTTKEDVVKAIDETGYKVIEAKPIK